MRLWVQELALGIGFAVLAGMLFHFLTADLAAMWLVLHRGH